MGRKDRFAALFPGLHLTTGKVAQLNVNDLANQIRDGSGRLDIGMPADKTRWFILLSPQGTGNLLCRNVVLQHVGNRLGQGGQQAFYHGSFLVCGNKQLCDLPVGIEIDGNIQLNIPDLGAVRKPGPPSPGFLPNGNVLPACPGCLQQFLIGHILQILFGFGRNPGSQGLAGLGTIPIYGNGFGACVVGQQMDSFNILHGGGMRQVYGLGNRSGNHGSDSGYHQHMSFR